MLSKIIATSVRKNRRGVMLVDDAVALLHMPIIRYCKDRPRTKNAYMTAGVAPVAEMFDKRTYGLIVSS